MRILLIKSGQKTNRSPRAPQPRGVLEIGTMLKGMGDEVRIYDVRLWWHNPPIEEVLVEFKPHIVGISALTVEGAYVHELAYRIRTILPQIPIIVGGPYVSSYPQEVLSDPNVDFGVLREGEKTMKELRAALMNGHNFEEIRGLAWRDKTGQIHINQPVKFMTEQEWNEMPIPDFDLLDLEGYFSINNMNQIGSRRLVTIVTSRGCNYGCIYCHNMFGKKLRTRRPELILDELKMLYEKYGVRDIEISDDAFLDNRPHATAILEGMIRNNLPMRLTFPNGLRGDIMDRDYVDLLKEAGTVHLTVSMETATPRLQKMINKNLNIDKFIENLNYVAKKRIYTCCYFMIGFPTETYEEAKYTIDVACKLPIHLVVFHAVTPFKGTKLGKKVGDLIVDPVHQGSYTTQSVNVSAMTDKQLFGLIRNGYLRFFANPIRQYRTLRDHPNLSVLPKLATLVFRRFIFADRKTPDALPSNQFRLDSAEEIWESVPSRSLPQAPLAQPTAG